jgi:protein-disulfide isomerase
MTRIAFRSALLIALLPLSLGLAACKKDAAGGAATTSSGALPKVPAPAGRAWSDVVAVTPDGGYRMGNPDAALKLVEYGSLSCPHCAHFAQQGLQTLSNDFVGSGRVSYEYRSFVIHPQDVPLTVLAQCAPQDAFFPMLGQIYNNFDALNAPLADQETVKKAEAALQAAPAQRWPGFADALGFTAFFAQRGLPTAQANACLADVSKAKAVADRSQKWGDSGIEETPTLLLNGNKLDAGDWASVKTALENAGAR